jgi:hypothetical protein
MKKNLSFQEARPPTIPWGFVSDRIEEKDIPIYNLLDDQTILGSSRKPVLTPRGCEVRPPDVVASIQHTKCGWTPTEQSTLKISSSSSTSSSSPYMQHVYACT